MSSELPGHYPNPITSTATGSGTGTVPEDANFIVVTSSSSSNFVTLPAGYVGMQVRGWSTANGFKFRTAASSSPTINNVDVSGGSAGAAIPATVWFLCEKVTATAWILRTRTNLGAEGTAIVPA